ncbi:hypothetical protein JCM9492_11230 [Aquifex pyrophilus]
MRILAIDAGFRLGYACGENGKLIKAGTIYAKETRELFEKVRELFEELKPEKVVIEDFRVYVPEFKGKHKTPLAIGIILAIAYERDIEVSLINHNTWKAQFKRIYPAVFPRLSEDWLNALEKGSEHSRDATAMLLCEMPLISFLKGGL